MQKNRYKLYLIASILVSLGALAAVIATRTTPKLGLDLKGGISVILTAESEEQVTEEVLARTVDIIRDRIDAIQAGGESEVSYSGSNILIQLPGIEDEDEALRVIGTTAQLTFRQVKEEIPATGKKLPEVTKDTSQAVNDEEVVYGSGEGAGILYRLEPAVLTGDVVERAEAIPDPQTRAWSVSIDMNDDGSEIWGEFTSKLACLRDKGEQVKDQVAIVLDGKVESAAGMDPNVSCGQGITGGGTQITTGGAEEAKSLALVLKTGALPLTLTQSEVRKVSPTLGRDSLEAGLLAGAIGLALVMLYVLLYYRALGFVVWGGLLVFGALTYSIMALLGQAAGLTLSLAGVAGMIVSVGVTTDSYIVAFERLKDETRSGKSMRAAVDRGMKRAFRTILVADFVTASAAVILFFLAVGPVKGFALTLGLATLIDVVVAYFFTRSAVNLLARSESFAGGNRLGLARALGVQQA